MHSHISAASGFLDAAHMKLGMSTLPESYTQMTGATEQQTPQQCQYTILWSLKADKGEFILH